MLIALMTYAGISAYNVRMNQKKLKKANKKIVYKLEDLGYDLDDKETKKICHDVVESYDKNYRDDIALGHFALSFFPILNIATFVNNIKSDDFLQDYYNCGIDNCLNEEVLSKLEEKNIIKFKDTKENILHYVNTVKINDGEEKKKEKVINNFKEKEYTIEELRIIRDYINGQMIQQDTKEKVRTR